MPRSPLLATVFVSIALWSTSAAAASEQNAAVKACEGKQDGALCVVNAPDQDKKGDLTYREMRGACAPSECCELDYSKGSPPDTKCSPCLACDGAKVAADGGPAPGSDAVAPGSDNVGEPPRTPGVDPPASAGNDKRGCAVGGPALPASLLVLFGLGLVTARRACHGVR